MQKIDFTFNPDHFKPAIVDFKHPGKVFCTDYRIRACFDKVLSIIEATQAKSMVFTFRPKLSVFPKSVSLIGTFNNWKIKWPLKFDNFSRTWKIYLNLPPGEY